MHKQHAHYETEIWSHMTIKYLVHKTYPSKAVFVKLRSILKHSGFVKISHKTALTSRLGDPRLKCFNAAGRQFLF